MSPKKKAKEIYDRFDIPQITEFSRKQCCVIVVDEIKEAIGWDDMELGVDRDDYWDKVIIEIELLCV